MTQEEAYLREQMGTRQPFRVPDGYFDRLTEDIMQRLPQQQTSQRTTLQTPQHTTLQTPRRTALIRHLRPLLYAAACLAVVVVGYTAVFNKSTTPDAVAVQPVVAYSEQAANTDSPTDEYLDEAADYAMLNNQDIYYLLADM